MPEFGYLPSQKPTEADNERFTTDDGMAIVRAVAGVTAFDLDAAACVESHHAPLWHGRQVDGSFVDGLVAPWLGRTFFNPPWSELGAWLAKAWREFDSGRSALIAGLLPGNRQDQPWWQEYVEARRDNGGPLTTRYPPGRMRFGKPGDPQARALVPEKKKGKLTGKLRRVAGVPHPVVVLVWRRFGHG